jgi:BirA family biotin operon repressor/biotin-[acetyl-CoA-carboxylase] ligase
LAKNVRLASAVYEGPLVFDLSRLAAASFVRRLDVHDSLGSTSDRALALAANDEGPLPLLVLVERQTAGRGRGMNRWLAAEGALTFSLALEAPPDRLPPVRWPQVALVAGLAVCEALQAHAPRADLTVKWPNDVYLSGQKVCGILSESVPGWRQRLVVGIGVNVNNRVQASVSGSQQGPEVEAPTPEVSAQRSAGFVATSLIEYDGMPRDLTDVLLTILDQLERRWSDFLEAPFAAIADDFRRRCFLAGKTVTVAQPGGQTHTGLCRGIDDTGALQLATEQGEQRVVSGTVAAWEAAWVKNR